MPKSLSPELVRTLMEMGHGDELVLADANYPGHALHSRVLRADGIGIPPGCLTRSWSCFRWIIMLRLRRPSWP
ncbi:RbsD/FucU domain-containing protein [Paenibacillus rhizoplanae]